MWIYSILSTSSVNGPGRRAVLWMSGCNLGCVGCFNPPTHAFRAGTNYTARELFDRVRAIVGLEGVTISGGEPLFQDRGLLEFLRLLKAGTDLSVIVFSGMTLTEIRRRLKKNQTEELLSCIDILKTGRYLPGRPTRAPLRGSANQRLHFLSARYTSDDLPAKAFEVIVRPGGQRIVTGFPPKRHFKD